MRIANRCVLGLLGLETLACYLRVVMTHINHRIVPVPVPVPEDVLGMRLGALEDVMLPLLSLLSELLCHPNCLRLAALHPLHPLHRQGLVSRCSVHCALAIIRFSLAKPHENRW